MWHIMKIYDYVSLKDFFPHVKSNSSDKKELCQHLMCTIFSFYWYNDILDLMIYGSVCFGLKI